MYETEAPLLTIEDAQAPNFDLEAVAPRPTPLDSYWAMSSDYETFLNELRKRVRHYLEYVDGIGLADRIERTWAMYHGLYWDDQGGPTAVKVAGEEGDIRIAEVNEMRTSLQLLKTYITSHRPEWDTLSKDEQAQSLQATKKGNETLDAILMDSTNGCEEALLQNVEDAIVLTSGWFWHCWDYTLGEETGVDETGKILHAGDYRFLAPAFFDVTFDHRAGKLENSPWVDARRLENRWDLMAEYPELAEEIDRLRDGDERQNERFDFGFNPERYGSGEASDFLWVHYTYIRPSCATKRGRYVKHLGWKIILDDQPELPDGGVPLHRLNPANFMLTPFGYTPAFSCQAPQELLNNVLSAIATNQNNFGITKLHKKGGDPINRALLEPGCVVVETDGELSPLPLLQTSPELYQSIPMFTTMVRAQSGVNDSSRGFSKAEESGAARAFQEQRTQQGSVDFVGNWDRHLSNVGTGILRGYAKRLQGQEPRMLYAAPGGDTRGQVELSAERLQGIQRVSVVRGNPEMRTLAGQMKVAEFLMQSGAAQITKEEFVSVAKGAGVGILTRSEELELDRIHRENDAIRKGIKSHVADPLDNQLLHMREHTQEAKTPEAEANPVVKQLAFAAVLEHQNILMDMMMSQMQAALGYNPGPLGMMAGAAPQKPLAPGQSPPGGSPKKIEGGNSEKGPPQLTGGVPKPGNNPPGGNPALAPMT